MHTYTLLLYSGVRILGEGMVVLRLMFGQMALQVESAVDGVFNISR